jgi:hypothetical protein
MASIVLGWAGQALGPSIFGAGFTLLGQTITGAQIGGALGALAGSFIDNALFAPSTPVQEGPRLSEVSLLTSSEGASIPRLWGRARLGGQIIWSTRFKETTTTSQQGGKGGQGGAKTKTYSYSVSFAVGLCEGPATRIGRVWADGKELELGSYTTRFHAGTEDQMPDPLIETIEGAGNAPGYRGLAYVVFEDMPLEKFGNRIPQLSFETFKATNDGEIEDLITGICLIPSSGEFVYATQPIISDTGRGTSKSENVHSANGQPDFTVAADQMGDLLPNLGAVLLVVAWFGTDLRCGVCEVKPGVELTLKYTIPVQWRVSGVERQDAYQVSQGDDRPNYGGTPSDLSVIQAIEDLKARGYDVIFYPFVLMDIEAGNGLPNPYGGAEQGAFPWRGRITCHPAAGRPGTVDKTAAAATQVDAFFGSAAASDVTVSGTTIGWSGSNSEWGYRRMILHYAKLCVAAGGVDGFLIGTELRGLTTIRSGAATYPAVAKLQTLAADVSAILGGSCKTGYAADWTEYRGHDPADGTGDFYFHLDPLWADANIDFVGIDNYAPLSDWRDGSFHLDFTASATRSIYDVAYLQSNVEAGERYDWFYSSQGDRDAQLRTPITDGAYGKPWVYRDKDFRNWWLNAHHNRPGGVESVSPTAWTPQSKPFWFTEFGCPAVEKGTNQPNVFFDPKSSESFIPYYSTGRRDDLIQRRYVEATTRYWTDAGNNPVSAVYGGTMVAADRMFVWCWDARPWPDYPTRSDIWGDTENWKLGHWLNGRLGVSSVPVIVSDICTGANFTEIDVSSLEGIVTGYVIDRTMSPRDALAPLSAAYFFDGAESEGIIRFVHRSGAAALELDEGDLVLGEDGMPGYTITRSQETDLPRICRAGFIEASADYKASSVESRRLVGSSERVAGASLPIVMEQADAQAISDAMLQETWVAREKANLALSPATLALDPTDIIDITLNGRLWRFQLGEINDALERRCTAARNDASIYNAVPGTSREVKAPPVVFAGPVLLSFMDLPLITGREDPNAARVAAFASPWVGPTAIFRSASTSGFTLNTTVAGKATLGALAADLQSGPSARWDIVNEIHVDLYGGTLASASELDVLGGANVLAIENQDGGWEVLQFVTATLEGGTIWKLSRLLRGQFGTEGAMRDPVAAGARVVVLNTAIAELDTLDFERLLAFNYRWGPLAKPQDDPSYSQALKQFQGVGHRPYSPVHVRGSWDAGSGDVVLSWKRRARLSADEWEQSDVPLGEGSERYDVDILDGPAVIRTIATTLTSATYTAAQQTADFGATQTSIEVVVYQLSEIFGRGTGRKATLTR